MHALKTRKATLERARTLYQVRESALYDRKLGMYKTNAPLAACSPEIGRLRAFTPGWLENESVFLHMAYKYLLEVLRAGLHDEFFADMRRGLVPFLDPQTYGRSPLENSSFIVSSAHPDESLHGRGFVARLTGATTEFLSMWTVHDGRAPPLLHERWRTLPGLQADAAGLALPRGRHIDLHLPGAVCGHVPQAPSHHSGRRR